MLHNRLITPQARVPNQMTRERTATPKAIQPIVLFESPFNFDHHWWRFLPKLTSSLPNAHLMIAITKTILIIVIISNQVYQRLYIGRISAQTRRHITSNHKSPINNEQMPIALTSAITPHITSATTPIITIVTKNVFLVLGFSSFHQLRIVFRYGASLS